MQRHAKVVPIDIANQHKEYNLALTTYEVYKQSKDKIAKKTHDFRDEIIVALWDKAAEALTLRKQLEDELARINDRCMGLSYDNETLSSRNARFEGTLSEDAAPLQKFFLKREKAA